MSKDAVWENFAQRLISTIVDQVNQALEDRDRKLRELEEAIISLNQRIKTTHIDMIVGAATRAVADALAKQGVSIDEAQLSATLARLLKPTMEELYSRLDSLDSDLKLIAEGLKEWQEETGKIVGSAVQSYNTIIASLENIKRHFSGLAKANKTILDQLSALSERMDRMERASTTGPVLKNISDNIAKMNQAIAELRMAIVNLEEKITSLQRGEEA